MEGRSGILTILDEQCKLGSGHSQFADKLFQHFIKEKKKHDPTERFSKPKVGRDKFTIRHYAGCVAYSVDKFLEKNKVSRWSELSTHSVRIIAILVIPTS